uniref:Uncharacterized protein n=1 Tax=Cacopsylla melanoneura TaxID=428564 RepID=A0A8D9FAM9_9HEMI
MEKNCDENEKVSTASVDLFSRMNFYHQFKIEMHCSQLCVPSLVPKEIYVKLTTTSNSNNDVQRLGRMYVSFLFNSCKGNVKIIKSFMFSFKTNDQGQKVNHRTK